MAHSNPPHDKELAILSHVHREETRASGAEPPFVSQRSIARDVGVSVGITNAIMKRLVRKGCVLMRRVDHNHARYLLTPTGMERLRRRTAAYLHTTIDHVVHYKELLRKLCRRSAARGITEIVLVGESDFAFIIEWCAHKEGLQYRATPSPPDPPSAEHTLLLLSETMPHESHATALHLADLLLKQE